MVVHPAPIVPVGVGVGQVYVGVGTTGHPERVRLLVPPAVIVAGKALRPPLQTGGVQTPQSAEQVPHVSIPLQTPSGHVAPQTPDVHTFVPEHTPQLTMLHPSFIVPQFLP